MVVFYFLYKSYRATAGTAFEVRVLFSLLLRAPVLALLIGIPLLMSLSWTFGFATLVFGNLNLLTSALGRRVRRSHLPNIVTSTVVSVFRN